MTEPELVKLSRRGDRSAQHELYVRTSQRIYRLLLKITRNPDDAFDLSQETYIRAFSRIDQFDGQSTFGTWLYRIAVNEALQFLRRSDRGRMNLQVLPVDNYAEPRCNDVAHKLDVEAALAQLRPLDRTMLLLRYQEGLDYRTIALITKVGVGTVASRLNRARKRVRALLQKSYA